MALIPIFKIWNIVSYKSVDKVKINSCPEPALIIYPMHFSKCPAHLPSPSPFLFQYLPL